VVAVASLDRNVPISESDRLVTRVVSIKPEATVSATVRVSSAWGLSVDGFGLPTGFTAEFRAGFAAEAVLRRS
jgi:hypothetical protein